MDRSELWSYDDDGRTVPDEDNPRLGTFKSGWTMALKNQNGNPNNAKYNGDSTPDTLYWENLGFRVGTHLGNRPIGDRVKIYEMYKDEMQANRQRYR